MGIAEQQDVLWEDIYRAWQGHAGEVYPTLLSKGAFHEYSYTAINPNVQLAETDINDWWSEEEVKDEELLSVMNRTVRFFAARPPEDSSSSESVNKGAGRTANLLWRTREDVELQSAVWIGASLLSSVAHRGYGGSAWGRDMVSQVYRRCFDKITAAKQGLPSSYTLPKSLSAHGVTEFRVEDCDHLLLHVVLEACAIEIAACQAAWRLVHLNRHEVVDKPGE